MQKIEALWKGSPAVRFLVRTVVVAVVTYVVDAYRRGDPLDPNALLTAAIVSGGTALVGLLTPVEPFVGPGFSKPENVEVPEPPAEPVPAGR